MLCVPSYFCYETSINHALILRISSQATKLSLLISLLTSTPRSSPSLVCRRCEKIGSSYFVPGCSSLRLGSKRRNNAVKGRMGDAGVFKLSECSLMSGRIEALEQVARELKIDVSVKRKFRMRKVLPFRRCNPRRFPPQGSFAVVCRKPSSLRRLSTFHQQDWEKSSESYFDHPLLIHTLGISTHAEEEKDQEATS